jgi:hypothetical protein
VSSASGHEPSRKNLPASRIEVRRVARCARRALIAIVSSALVITAVAPARDAQAAVSSSAHGSATQVRAAPSSRAGSSLESAAARAGDTGRAVAMSLIGLAFAVAATVLAFRRDFKEAAGVFAVGIVSVLLATPTGVSVLRDTVSSLFGA